MNLWWFDRTHASVYGSYLSALVSFGTISGRNPTAFGANEKAAKDLGISQNDAVLLQNIAAETLVASGVVLR
jgi:ribose/xylose/arabinose/galactoside ABC-type transport system permease subunit